MKHERYSYLPYFSVKHALMSDADTTPTLMLTLNYVIFSNYYRYRRLNVRVRRPVSMSLHCLRLYTFVVVADISN
jgi:hypothetical protein